MWLLEKVGGRFVWKKIPMILGWVLGAQYRSLRDDLEAVKRNPGNGEVATRLIARIPIFERVVSIFNDFKLAPKQIAEDGPYLAMVHRLRNEGPTTATIKYLGCGNDEEDYEWAIEKMIDEATKEVPNLRDVLEREAIENLNSLRYPKNANDG